MSRQLVIEGRSVLVAANRADEEPQRLDRLERVARAAVERGLPLSHLYDHKGILSASLTTGLTEERIALLRELWADENEYAFGGLYEGGALVQGQRDDCFTCYLPRPLEPQPLPPPLPFVEPRTQRRSADIIQFPRKPS